MLRYFLVLLSILPALAQITKPVQVYSTSGQLQWPPTFFFTNIFAAGGTTLSFDSLGRMTISSVAGSGTNALYQTNGVSVGSAGTVNWTTGVTGYLASGVAHLGVNVSPSGGGASVADLLVVSNQLQTASNKFDTDISNLQGATNGLQTMTLNASNVLRTDISNLQGATNSFHSTNANLANHINNVATNTIKWLTNIWGDVGRGFGGLANDQVLTYHSLSGTWTNKTPTGSGTPAGNSGAVQFNESGVFAGTNDLVFDRTNKLLRMQATGVGTTIGKFSVEYPAIGTSYFGATTLIASNVGFQTYLLGLNIGSVFNGIQIATNNISPGGNSLSNHTDVGRFDLPWRTNWAEAYNALRSVRIGYTNGGGTVFADAGVWRPTNVFVFNVTNPVAGQILKFHTVSYSGPTATIILTNDVDSGGSGSGTTITSGSTEADFGAAPGSDIATIVITGQATILSGSYVRAWKAAEATADHTAFDAVVTDINISCTAPTAGTGFTIYALSRMGRLTGKYKVYWSWYN